MFKQYYLHRQKLVYCAHDAATWLLSGIFLRPIAARLSKCLPFFGIVIILMTFVCILKVVSPLSSNFISTFMDHAIKFDR